MKNLIKLGLMISSFAPLMTFAVEAGGITGQTGLAGFTLKNLIDNVAAWATGLLIALSVLFVIYAAFLYLTAGGDAKAVEGAKNIIIYAVVAIVIALMAQVVKSIAGGLVGVSVQ